MRVQGAKKNPNLINVTEPQNDVTVNVTNLPKARIHNVFIVDASGSMGGSKYDSAIKGVNELLISIGSDTDSDNTVTIVEFEGSRIEKRLDTTSDIPKKYKGMGVGGSTPLNQAIGETLEYIVSTRKNKFDKSDKVLVSVFTDGDENTSRGKWQFYSDLNKFIKELESDGVTTTLIGTQEVVNYAVNRLSLDITNTLVHNNTAADIKRSFDTTLKARNLYSKSVSLGEDVKKSFYTKTIN
jgi:Mg-chelatase subunit ChlD